jgi:GNAT superfamily N-acetyltransferase
MISALAITVWVETSAMDGIEPAFGRYIADDLSEAAYTDLLADEGNIALLALCDERLVGFVIVALNRSVDELDQPAAELAKLYIHQRFKGLGIGRTLFDWSYRAAREVGFTSLWLSVYHGNADAISFYRSLNLQQISDCYFELDGELHLNHRFIRVME